MLQSHEFPLHLDLHQFLRRNGGPVVPIMSCINGDLFTNWRGRQFELQTWISGLRRLSVQQSRRFGCLGRGAGKVSRCIIGILLYVCRELRVSRFTSNTIAHSAGLKLWRGFHTFSRAPGDEDQRCRSTVERLVHWVRHHGDALESAALPQQFIHGDCLYNNCLVDENGMLFIVDLDTASWGYRITDIASALAFAGGIVVTDEDSVSGRIGETLNRSAMQRVFDGFSATTTADTYRETGAAQLDRPQVSRSSYHMSRSRQPEYPPSR